MLTVSGFLCSALRSSMNSYASSLADDDLLFSFDLKENSINFYSNSRNTGLFNSSKKQNSKNSASVGC